MVIFNYICICVTLINVLFANGLKLVPILVGIFLRRKDFIIWICKARFLFLFISSFSILHVTVKHKCALKCAFWENRIRHQLSIIRASACAHLSKSNGADRQNDIRRSRTKRKVLTVDHGEEINYDAESPTHFYGSTWSSGVLGHESSTLRRSALFFPHMPGSSYALGTHIPELIAEKERLPR